MHATYPWFNYSVQEQFRLCIIEKMCRNACSRDKSKTHAMKSPSFASLVWINFIFISNYFWLKSAVLTSCCVLVVIYFAIEERHLVCGVLCHIISGPSNRKWLFFKPFILNFFYISLCFPACVRSYIRAKDLILLHKKKKKMCHSYKSPSFPANGKVCLECSACTSPALCFTVVYISDWLEAGDAPLVTQNMSRRKYCIRHVEVNLKHGTKYLIPKSLIIQWYRCEQWSSMALKLWNKRKKTMFSCSLVWRICVKSC